MPNTAFRKGKSALPQAWTTIFQKSSGLVNFTWHCNAATLTTKVMEDLYFRMSSLTYSKPTTIGRDDGDPTLWLHRTRGNTLTSPPPLFSTPPKVKWGRIIVIGIRSPAGEAWEGCALLRRQEVSPPVRRETLNLSEEKDSLLETPWQVSSKEESPMQITSRSIRGY